MTEGKEWRQILLFTLPIMAGNLLQQLYNIVDGIIVGNYVGQEALSAVGTCGPVTLLFISLAIGMSNGCAVIVAQYFGAGEREMLRRSVSTALILLIVFGAVLSVVGIAAARPILDGLLGVPGEALNYALSYFRIYSAGLVFQFTYNIAAGILRAVGDSAATLYFLLVAALANVVLDLLFVAVFDLGVAGAAAATVIAQIMSAVVSMVYMFRRHEVLRFSLRQLQFHREMGLLALKLGVPSTLQHCAVSCGNMAIYRVVNSFGVDVMAAFTAGTRVDQLVLVPALGFSVGMTTFTGQNVGAGRLERVPRGLHATLGMTAAVSIVLAVIVWVFARPLVSAFGVEDAALTMGMEYVRFAAPFFVVFATYNAMGGVLQGSGDVMAAAGITLSTLFIRVIVVYIMAYATPIGYAAPWVSIPVGWGLAFLCALLRYRFGPWRRKGIVKSKKVGLRDEL